MIIRIGYFGMHILSNMKSIIDVFRINLNRFDCFWYTLKCFTKKRKKERKVNFFKRTELEIL